MKRPYEVKKGDCIDSIAKRFNLAPEAIWDHQENAKLKELRGNPNVLAPGDLVKVPDKVPAEDKRAANQRHRYRRKGVPAILKVRVLGIDGSTRAGEPYSIDIDGDLRANRKVNSRGFIKERIPPDAKKALVTFEDGEKMGFELGELDPIDTIRGVQDRLINMGHIIKDEKGTAGEETEAAVRAFETECAKEPSGKWNDKEFRKLLRDTYNKAKARPDDA